MTTAATAYRLLRDAGVNPGTAVILTAVGGAESGWDENAVGDQSLTDATWGPSVGIWQIRTLKADTGTGRARDIVALRGNPAFQAKAARSVLHSQGLSAWTTYKSGAYRSYLSSSRHVATRRTARSARGASGVPGGQVVAASLGITPAGWTDVLPWNWPGAVGSAVGGVGADFVNAVRPLFITGMFVAAGIGLSLIGLAVAARPTANKITGALGVPSP